MMKRIFCGLLLSLLLLVNFVSKAQIKIESPVYTEDFGTVPDNWTSWGPDGRDYYSDGGSLNTLRLPLDFDGKSRGTVHYEFAKRKMEWSICSFSTKWWSNTMSDLDGGDGKYALAVHGNELGATLCASIKSWHNGLNHTGENGLAFLANSRQSANSPVLENIVDEYVTVDGGKIIPGQIYEFKVYLANVEDGTGTEPQVKMVLESGSSSVPFRTEDLTPTKADQAMVWQEVKIFKEAGEAQIKYTFYSVKSDNLGNAFVIDDISLSPVSVRAEVVNVNFCKYPGNVNLETTVGDVPEGLKVWSRLMRRLKSGGDWEWVGSNAVDSLSWQLPDTDYLKYDFRMAVALSEGEAIASRILDGMEPNAAGFINEYGPYSVSDNLVTQEYCLSLERVSPDYTSIVDSVQWNAVLNNVPEGAVVYSRWMWQSFEGGAWSWWGDAKDYSHHPIDWVTFTTGNFRCVYAFSPELLGMLDCNVLNSRELYCITSELIGGSDYMVLLTERFDGGAAILEAEVTGAPMGAALYVRWMQRSRSGGDWEAMSPDDVLAQRVGLVTYSAKEYRVAVSLSYSAAAQLNIQEVVNDAKEYRLSEVFSGRDYRLENIPVDFCEKPGEAVKAISFTSNYPEDVPAHGRWMQREKGGSKWSWKDPIVNKIPLFGVPMSDYLTHDYRLVLSWSRDSLLKWDADTLPSGRDYYLLQDVFYPEPICLTVDTIRLISRKRGEFVLQPEVSKGQEEAVVYGRWMRIPQGDTEWEWVTDVADAGQELTVSVADFGAYSYRFYAAYSPDVLVAPVAKMWDQVYFAAKTIEGKRVYEPEVVEKELTCVAKQDCNKVLLRFENRGDITSFTYRIGNGEVVRQDAGKSEFEFTIGQDTAFYLLSYAYQGVADSIIMNDTLKFTYLPKLKIERLVDVFTCGNGDVQLAPTIVGCDKPVFQWFKNDADVPFSIEDTLQMRMTEAGTMPLKLVVSAEGVCPEDSTVHVITAEHPEIHFDRTVEEKEICVGQEFAIGYDLIDADQYRVTLKSATMPDFIFYPGNGNVGEGPQKVLVVKSGQTALTATDFMINYEFTFKVQIFKIVNYNGASYRCEDEFEYTFRVRPNPVAKFAPELELCAGSELELNPEIDPRGNHIRQYRWQLWDGRLLTADELKASDSDCSLSALVDGDWNKKRLQLVTLSECGEVTVQDMALSVYVSDSNRISGPDGMVITGERVNMTGSEIGLKNTGYQWEQQDKEENWNILPGETLKDLSILAPGLSSVYRRRIIGGEYGCSDMVSNEIRLNVFDNEHENIIYIHDEDSLVYSGTVVTVYSDSPQREGINYSWQRYDFGIWTDVPDEHGNNLTITMDEITMVRRVATVGKKSLYSNPVVINVYDSSRNRILYTGGLVTNGTRIQILGNFVDITGVHYKWYKNAGNGWVLIKGQEASRLEQKIDGTASFVRYVYLPSQPDDSLRSNEVTVYVFDNAADNVINSDLRNVCAGEEVSVSGKEIGADGVTWCWECSYDQGNVWEVLEGQSGANLTFTAEKSVSVRRTLLYGALQDCFSNVLEFNVIHNSSDNIIGLPKVVFAGQPVVIQGSEIKDAAYLWEESENGEENWVVLEGERGQNLSLSGEMTNREKFFRRSLAFEDVAQGCDGVSNVLKMAVLDKERTNMVTKPEGNICRWSEFTVSGSDMSDFGAKYQWYSNSGNGWQLIELGFGKDITIYEGIGRQVSYRRDAAVDGEVYESNVLEINLWDVSMFKNILETPMVACPGAEVVIKGADILAGEQDLSGYFKSYLWEESITGAGGTWTSTDSVNTKDLLLKKVEEPGWYRRVVETYCGDENRSMPVFLEVKERLPLTLRHDALTRLRKVKEPITVFVDEDFYVSYEFKIDNKAIASEGPKCLFYGWMPGKDYNVVANVATESGCVQTDTLGLHTPDVDLPNVLTPNDDGYNDVLLVGYDLKVFNRWGNLLYSGTGGWDGRYKGQYVAAGTYFYVVKLTHENGKVSEYKCSVTVKR